MSAREAYAAIAAKERAEQFDRLTHNYGLSESHKLYFILRHVSSSGLSRYYDIFALCGTDILRITWTVAVALGYRYNRKHEAIDCNPAGVISYLGHLAPELNQIDYNIL